MTDLQQFISLYKSFGVKLKAKRKNDIQIVKIKEGTKKITGYSGFYTEVVFDSAGNFIRQGIWE